MLAEAGKLAASCSPFPAPRMCAGHGYRWCAWSLLDFRSSVTRTNASGWPRLSAARWHALSIVFQHDLLFVFSPYCFQPQVLHIPVSSFALAAQGYWKTKQNKQTKKPPYSWLWLEKGRHGGSAQSHRASLKKDGGGSFPQYPVITDANPKNQPCRGSILTSTCIPSCTEAWGW